MELWLATGNKGKVTEYKVLLNTIANLELHTQADMPAFTQPPENGKTFLENARIKAKALHAVKPDVWVLGEDTGLEVEGLGGMPGIHTARYAGPHARDSENVAKLLKMMSIRPMANRNAQFTCVLVVYSPQGAEWVFHGQLKGSIAKSPSGNLGFGYDPIFIPEGETKTLSELGDAYKNQKSHRAACAKQFLEKLKS